MLVRWIAYRVSTAGLYDKLSLPHCIPVHEQVNERRPRNRSVLNLVAINNIAHSRMDLADFGADAMASGSEGGILRVYNMSRNFIQAAASSSPSQAPQAVIMIRKQYQLIRTYCNLFLKILELSCWSL